MRAAIAGLIVMLCGNVASLALAQETVSPQRGWERLLKLVSENQDAEFQRDVLRGIFEGLQGRRSVPRPAGWSEIYRSLEKSPDAEVRRRATALALLFGDQEVRAAQRTLLSAKEANLDARREALQLLSQAQDAELPQLCRPLLESAELRIEALRALAAYAQPETAELILAAYASWPEDARQEALATLAARLDTARKLLSAVAAKRIPRADLSPVLVRQLLAHNNPALKKEVEEVWGTLRPASQEKVMQMSVYRGQLTPRVLEQADRGHGRLLYQKHCASCHRLFDEGGKIGPDLTGAKRTELDYWLENLLDPSAVVPRDYQLSVVILNSGRVLTGVVAEEFERSLTLQTATERIVLPLDEIDQREKTKQSLMPEGLLRPLSAEEVRDLFGYLAGPGQVALPATGPNKSTSAP